MVIPVHDENPVRRTPWVTYALILINVVVFFALEPIDHFPTVRGTTVQQYCEQQRFFADWAAIPREITSGDPIGRQAERIPGTPLACVLDDSGKSPVLSILTAMFLHGGLFHLAGNMLFLWVFGNNIEDRLGRLKYLLFYLACGYAATYGFAYANADSTTTLIGASGAIAGVLGAYFVLYPRARITTLVPFLFFLPFRLPAWLVLGFWFLLQYAYSTGAALTQGAGVAYLAHVVGFVVGLLFVLVFVDRDRRSPPRQQAPW